MENKNEIPTSKEILAQENSLVFNRFSHHDAWLLAENIMENYYIVAQEQSTSKEIGIRIVIDNLLVFQYLMEKKTEDAWLERKQRTVLYTGHSSLYVCAKNNETGEYSELLDDDRYTVGGGGFPINIGNAIRGLIAVSGFPHYLDHELIVRTLELCREKGKLNFSD